MYFKQKDIFGSLDRNFVKQFMDVAETISLEAGELLFQEGDAASWLYILLRGRMKLSLGQTGRVVYVVSQGGEAFGWSSLVGRQSYSATAEGMTAAKLLRFEKNRLEKIVEKDTANGLQLFKNLAALLGGRLIHAYSSDLSTISEMDLSSYGTGQVVDVPENELEG